MDDVSERCPDCAATYATTDNYCRQCGMYVAALRPGLAMTTRTESLALEPVRPGLPAPVRRAATAVAVGAALQVGFGLATRYFAAQAANKGARAVVTAAPPKGRKGREVTNAERTPVADDRLAAVSETVVIRRVWIRRP